ncbi:uncharacterized protein [Pocillopora verrucosa]|uniref:uncharacterized protein n=1 Tax=Pocillopora verrucosa TaxID=203993 RepID=UPI0033420683
MKMKWEDRGKEGKRKRRSIRRENEFFSFLSWTLVLIFCSLKKALPCIPLLCLKRLSGAQNRGETKPPSTKERKRRKSKRSRKNSVDRLNWEMRARCDIKLMWQISIGEGQDICLDEVDYFYENDWTPTEDDFKLFDKQSNGGGHDFPSFTYSPKPWRKKCGKDHCFFEDGSILYL